MVVVVLSLMAARGATAERAYPLGCSLQDRSYYDFESAAFPPPGIPLRSTDDYMLVQRLGAGKFSDVFEAVDVQLERSTAAAPSSRADRRQPAAEIDPRTLVVLKCLKPVAERKIKRELLVLQHASKLPNLARLLAIVVPPGYFYSTGTSPSSTDGSSGTSSSNNSSRANHRYRLQPMPTLVLEHGRGDWLCHPIKVTGSSGSWGSGSTNRDPPAGGTTAAAAAAAASDGADVVQDGYLTEDEIRYYLFHLLVALDQLHSVGVMHRDVKPRNVLIDRKRRTLMLIDLGLADFYLPQTSYNVRVASRHYKSPELLLGYELYDYAIDLWGVGCILAGLLLRKEPFFRGKDNVDQLATIVAVLGTADLHRYMAKYKIEMTSDVRQIIAKYTMQGGSGNQKEWTSLFTDPTFTPSPEGIDLLSKLLRYDHGQRLTANQAMQHPFFDPVRMQVQRELHERQLRGDSSPGPSGFQY
jgi:serine/threonine protein kinase